MCPFKNKNRYTTFSCFTKKKIKKLLFVFFKETSFQVVLISNGHLSFVVMNYGAIAPTQRYVQVGTR